jgi:hypothetical protein
LSVYLIAISVLLFVPETRLPPSAQRHLSEASIVASVLLLVLAVVEGEQNYRLKADRLHRCATELLALEVRLDNLGGEPPPARHALDALAEEFTQIVQRCPENHLPMDYYYFRATRPEDFGVHWLPALIAPFHYWLRVVLPYLLAILGPPATLFLLLAPQS